MLVKTSPVRVLHRGPYSSEGDRDPVTWGENMGDAAGSLIEKLIVLDPSTGTTLDNLTLDPSVKPEDVAEFSMVTLQLEWKREQKPAFSRSGRDYIATKDKFRVVKAERVREQTASAA
jgi:hypothetical protein